MQRRKKKDSLLVKRPEPPSFTDILADLQTADDDDILFTFAKDFIGQDQSSVCSSIDQAVSTNQNVHSKSGSSSSLHSDRTQSTESSTNQMSSDVESAYQKGANFIQTMDMLVKAPARLESRCNQLETTSGDLRETIESLCRQATELKAFALPR